MIETTLSTSSDHKYEPNEEQSATTTTMNEANSATTATMNEASTDSPTLTPKSAHRTFAPLNTPLYRRRQTLAILIWLLMPWFCLY